MGLRKIIDIPERMGGEVYYREEKFLHDPELREAYECGYKHGRKEAYKEIMEEQYGERRHYSHGSLPPRYREDWRMPEDDEVVYRRRRRANGEFY